MEDVEEEVPMTAQYLLQQSENDIMRLRPTEMLPINADDDDEQHLVSM
jgi:hypothetical protein